MKRINITIETENAAFDGDEACRHEVFRMLQSLCNGIARQGFAQTTLRDINGNVVGHVAYEE